MRLNTPIETIVFDLDGTLRHSVPSANDAQYQFALELGVPPSDGQQSQGARWAHYYWAQSSELLSDLEKHGELNDNFWVHYSFRYLQAINTPQDMAAKLAPILFQRMRDEFTPQNHVYPCVPETLQAIREAGYQVGLVSNRSQPCLEECEQLGLIEYFDFAYVAGEVNAWKPDPRIFDRALEEADSLPHQILYIGDNYFADILGAKRAGLQPVLLDPDGIFPEADCLVIHSLRELTTHLSL